MTFPSAPLRRLVLLSAAIALVTIVSACGSGKAKLPALGSIDADKFLFERGTEALAKKRWYEANEYFRRLVESYPQSTYRQNAKLGLGDSLLGLHSGAADILAINEFREFLQFFPLNERADYALYQICMAESRQTLSPERDQTATKEALKDIELFLTRHPTSSLRPKVEKLRREAQDKLSDSEYAVGVFNFRQRIYGGAIQRFNYLLQHDPEYTRRDAVYYYLAQSLVKANLKPAAVVSLTKLVEEFPKSKYYAPGKKLLDQIK